MTVAACSQFPLSLKVANMSSLSTIRNLLIFRTGHPVDWNLPVFGTSGSAIPRVNQIEIMRQGLILSPRSIVNSRVHSRVASFLDPPFYRRVRWPRRCTAQKRSAPSTSPSTESSSGGNKLISAPMEAASSDGRTCMGALCSWASFDAWGLFL